MSHQFDVRPSVLYENRYCDQNEFDIVINYEGKNKDSTNCIIKIEYVDVKCNVVLIQMSTNRYYSKTAVIASKMYVFGRPDKIVRKTSFVDTISRSTWKNLTSMPDLRKNFLCLFIYEKYIFNWWVLRLLWLL